MNVIFYSGRALFPTLVLWVSLFGSTQDTAAQDTANQDSGISAEEFEKLIQEVDTPTDKPWRSIPWKISLLEAQNEAAESGKPIFIWAMDGHPLGCT